MTTLGDANSEGKHTSSNKIKIFHFTQILSMWYVKKVRLFLIMKRFLCMFPLSPNPFLDEFYCKMFQDYEENQNPEQNEPPKKRRPGFLKNKINQRKIPLNLQQYFNWKKKVHFSLVCQYKRFLYLYIFKFLIASSSCSSSHVRSIE